MSEDVREANRIIRRWVQQVTGVSDAERAMQKLTDALQGVATTMREAFDPLQSTIDRLIKDGHITQEDIEETQ